MITLGKTEAVHISIYHIGYSSEGESSLLLERYGTEKRIVYDDMREYLGKKKRDIFVNEVSYTSYGNGIYSMEIDAPHFPVYLLKLTTSKGNVYDVILT